MEYLPTKFHRSLKSKNWAALFCCPIKSEWEYIKSMSIIKMRSKWAIKMMKLIMEFVSLTLFCRELNLKFALRTTSGSNFSIFRFRWKYIFLPSNFHTKFQVTTVWLCKFKNRRMTCQLKVSGFNFAAEGSWHKSFTQKLLLGKPLNEISFFYL